MSDRRALEAQQEAIAEEVAAWLRSALDPNHPGAPAADRIVTIYMLADLAKAAERIADRLENTDLALAVDRIAERLDGEAVDMSEALEFAYQRGRADVMNRIQAAEKAGKLWGVYDFLVGIEAGEA